MAMVPSMFGFLHVVALLSHGATGAGGHRRATERVVGPSALLALGGVGHLSTQQRLGVCERTWDMK